MTGAGEEAPVFGFEELEALADYLAGRLLPPG